MIAGFDASKVAPKLYVGSYPGDGAEMFARAKAGGFARVIRVAAELPNEYALDDTMLTREAAAEFRRAAHDVAEGIAVGRRTLVTCQAGINRSALVAGLAMVEAYRCMGADALRQIRRHRIVPGGLALRNASFAAFLAFQTPRR